MTLRFPIRPDRDYLADLRQSGPDGALAASTIESAWFEIDRLRSELDRTIDHDLELRGALAITAVRDSFDPVGHFVYVLYGDADAILYVGRSSNILARLGDHMEDPDRRPNVRRVGLIRCSGYHEAMRLEMELIRQHRPPMNVVGVT